MDRKKVVDLEPIIRMQFSPVLFFQLDTSKLPLINIVSDSRDYEYQSQICFEGSRIMLTRRKTGNLVWDKTEYSFLTQDEKAKLFLTPESEVILKNLRAKFNADKDDYIPPLTRTSVKKAVDATLLASLKASYERCIATIDRFKVNTAKLPVLSWEEVLKLILPHAETIAKMRNPSVVCLPLWYVNQQGTDCPVDGYSLGLRIYPLHMPDCYLLGHERSEFFEGGNWVSGETKYRNRPRSFEFYMVDGDLFTSPQDFKKDDKLIYPDFPKRVSDEKKLAYMVNQYAKLGMEPASIEIIILFLMMHEDEIVVNRTLGANFLVLIVDIAQIPNISYFYTYIVVFVLMFII